MSNHSTATPRTFGPPLADCPDWCKEHATEISGPYDAWPGSQWDQHRQILDRRFYPAQVGTWPDGVRTLTVEQSGFDGAMRQPTATLTMWPGTPREQTQSLSVDELRDLIAAAANALAIIEATR